eukprot:TRINITY_DN49256_c0_g1_i1.p2 TRINITY_DN49256_c0_g1~~TRINITY_DN49256_c0_g1_i1.p2  ORF type:complete len:113 (+),score=18.07 TRINITY_DN49256_c0_g1_i1:52-390(+)
MPQEQFPVDPENRTFTDFRPKTTDSFTDFLYDFTEAKNNFVRNEWIRAEEKKIIAEKLSECVKREGVNQLQNCRKLSEEFMKRNAEGGIRGWRPHVLPEFIKRYKQLIESNE